ncbi:MAG: ABC transporter ATP-binding protein [Planctomycetota bacterium]
MPQTMIEVEDLKRAFGPVKALRGVSFAVPRGEVVGLLGPNGAGKTTAMRIITGFLAPTGGRARVAGKDVVEDRLACSRHLGYLPEGNPLYGELRLREALRFTARLHGLRGAKARQAVDGTIETAGLHGYDRRILGTLSKGERQRAGLAQALLHDPDILVLDEPTSGLDPNQQEEMRELIRTLGADHTVMLSTHILPEVEAVCDRALIISQGQLVADGSVDEIRRQQQRGTRVTIVVRGTEDAARQAFGALAPPGSIDVAPAVGEPAVLRVHVMLPGEEGNRERLERVAAAAHAAGLPLSELRAETASLEQVFARLTLGGDGNGGPEPEGAEPPPASDAADEPAATAGEEV